MNVTVTVQRIAIALMHHCLDTIDYLLADCAQRSHQLNRRAMLMRSRQSMYSNTVLQREIFDEECPFCSFPRDEHASEQRHHAILHSNARHCGWLRIRSRLAELRAIRRHRTGGVRHVRGSSRSQLRRRTLRPASQHGFLCHFCTRNIRPSTHALPPESFCGLLHRVRRDVSMFRARASASHA